MQGFGYRVPKCAERTDLRATAAQKTERIRYAKL